jgi:biopolymer transport protein ExbD
MVSVGSGKSDKKNLDAEVNLVPFIDLLSMCICFLLMTAVWIQIGSLEVKQSKGTDAAPSTGYELDVNFQASNSLQLQVKKQGKSFQSYQLKAKNTEELIKTLDTSIQGVLVKLKADPAQPSPISAAMITPKTGVSYGDLVQVLDTLRKYKIVNLGVTPAGAT